MSKIVNLVNNNEVTQVLAGRKKGNLSALSLSPKCLYIASAFNLSKKTMFIVEKNLYQAQRLYSQLVQLVPIEDVVSFCVDESLRVEAIAASPEMMVTRNETLAKLLHSEKPLICVTHSAAIIRYLPSVETYKKRSIILSVGMNYSLNELKTTLSKAGYEHTSKVDQPMTFASRGGIVDIFPLNHEGPIRIEFFDTEIESIRYFDVVTQRTINQLAEVYISPASEILFDEALKTELIDSIKNELEKTRNRKDEDDFNILQANIQADIDNIINDYSNSRLYKYYALCTKKHNIFEYVKDANIILDTYDEIEGSYKQLVKENFTYINEVYEENKGLRIFDIYYEINELLSKYQCISFYNFGIKDTISTQSNPLTILAAGFNNIMEQLISKASETKVLICQSHEYEIKQVRNYLEENSHYTLQDISDLKADSVGFFLIDANFEEGFVAHNDNFIVVSSKELFNKKPKIARYANKFKEAEVIKNYQELHNGDYIVHEQYGVGQYIGIVTKEIEGVHKDFLHVAYRNDEMLLVPLEQFHLVRKFTGKEGVVPKIHKLGSNEWEKTKTRVKERINDLADRLVALYALREQKIGYAFEKDDAMQQEFEDAFDFELTADQKVAIRDIKKDMEDSKPMDRLLCGDVGFGKTEVAIRAAFKAVLNHKQVAFLCPTTILSAQHYKTFKKRFENFPVNVALVNRFVEQRLQKEIIKKVNNHEIDILIGTHRLLSNDFKFKDLGLLVIDEEQRFGVEHKEKIKELKNGIDVLSLSATPIPRTLQMSLVGIRSLSQLDTPPKNRIPVQTYVIEKNEFVVREIIERELSRDGQVFYLYNRVNRIFEVAAKLEKEIPGAVVGVAHGKMSRIEIEDVMEKFTNNEFNVLVCTTIIETGIDIPNANTIIIEDADRFGLSQLYQIKGRVGRSERLAYAYLLYNPAKILNEIAMKRLQSIKEFTQLGSGYKIAMRDLAIRGAGDMLGPEQAGFIDTVGMDLYLEMLSDAIKEKTNQKEEKVEIRKVKMGVDAYLPADFESEDLQKITLYQQIDKISTPEQLSLLKEEVIDRYGKLPKSVSLLFDKKSFEIMISSVIIDHYQETNNGMEIIFTKEYSSNVDGVKLFEKINKISKSIKIKYSLGKISITIPKTNKTLEQALQVLKQD